MINELRIPINLLKVKSSVLSQVSGLPQGEGTGLPSRSESEVQTEAGTRGYAMWSLAGLQGKQWKVHGPLGWYEHVGCTQRPGDEAEN